MNLLDEPWEPSPREALAQMLWDATRAQEPEHFMPTVMTDMGSCLHVADALIAAGVRVVPWQYTQAATYPPGDYTLPDDLPQTARATHRRRHLSEPWERVPDDEEHEPTSITLSADGEP